jgi:hypothetical protein
MSFNFHFLVSTTINAKGQLVTDCKTHLETAQWAQTLYKLVFEFL